MIHEPSATTLMCESINRDFVRNWDTKTNHLLLTECLNARNVHEVERACRYWHIQDLLMINLDVEEVDFNDVCETLRIGGK